MTGPETAPKTATHETNGDIERRLLRLLHGELPAAEARDLERRIDSEPQLAAVYRRLAADWEFLDLPAVAPAPADFSSQVMAAARRGQRAPWGVAPAWGRASAVAALFLGVVLGTSFGAAVDDPAVDLDLDADGEAYVLAEPLSLSESFWLVAESDEWLENGDESAESSL